MQLLAVGAGLGDVFLQPFHAVVDDLQIREHQIIRELSTSPEYSVAVGRRAMQFRTTNALVRNPTWEIGLQKTGYISEAGRCLVMQATLAGRQLIMVFLDSAGKYSRLGDAERVRRWITELGEPAPAATTAHAVAKPAT